MELSEHTTKLAKWTQESIKRRRGEPDYTGYEEMDLVTALGENALLSAGAWNGSDTDLSITASGDPVERLEENGRTYVVDIAANSMRGLSTLVNVMDGEDDSFKPSKTNAVTQGRKEIAYKLGRQILNQIN